LRALGNILNVLAGKRSKVGTSHQILEFLIASNRAHGAFFYDVHACESLVFVQGLVLVRGRGGKEDSGKMSLKNKAT